MMELEGKGTAAGTRERLDGRAGKDADANDDEPTGSYRLEAVRLGAGPTSEEDLFGDAAELTAAAYEEGLVWRPLSLLLLLLLGLW